jgi:hypothetical protein
VSFYLFFAGWFFLWGSWSIFVDDRHSLHDGIAWAVVVLVAALWPLGCAYALLRWPVTMSMKLAARIAGGAIPSEERIEKEMVMKKIVTQEVTVDPRIEDLVRFALYLSSELGATSLRDLTEKDLIEMAEKFWDAQHGED